MEFTRGDAALLARHLTHGVEYGHHVQTTPAVMVAGKVVPHDAPAAAGATRCAEGTLAGVSGHALEHANIRRRGLHGLHQRDSAGNVR